ncbi:HTH domain-containing protein, partial [Soehngenia saccharolytica]
ALTEREQEVLKMLLASDEEVQEIANRLYISRAMLYRYISSLNKKTDTNSRIGLIQFYYTWKPEKKADRDD